MKRAGERGKGKWQRVSWDEALDSIAEKLKDIANRYGKASVAWLILNFPDLTPLSGAGYMRLMSLTGGTWPDWWGAGDAAGPDADIATFGKMMGEAYLYAQKDPKFGIIWGSNRAVTACPFLPMLKGAKKNGCNLAAIDPRFTKTASYADEYIPIRPGTDAALALGMVQVILEQNLQDDAFIAEKTVGPLLVRNDTGLFLRERDLADGGNPEKFLVFDQNSGEAASCDNAGLNPALMGTYSLSGIECRPAYDLLATLVKKYTPEIVANITDVPAEVVRRLAFSYATEKPAVIFRGWGLQRTFHGDLSARAINTLAAITGNMNLNLPPDVDFDQPAFYTPGGPFKIIPILSLHSAVTQGKPFPIKAIWCAGHNFVTTMPNTNKVVGELLPELELLVVCDLFMTATARYADFVLPVTSFYESADISMFAYNLQLQRKIIDPIYESRSDFRIAADLGRRMGFGQYFDKSEEQYIDEILALNRPATEGITLETLKQGPEKVKLPDIPWRMNTPTGRVTFYVESLKPFGQELPIYIEPVESALSKKAKRYPLSFLSSHPANRIHSTMANAPTILNKDPEPFLEINPSDAGPRDISHGDVVRIFNDRGQVKVRAKVTGDIKPGVVNITEGWWPEQFIEGQVNNLTHDMINPAQQEIKQANAAYCDTLVEVEKVMN
jgi:molybdopterin-containing oxidoreductase family molybdopterin binding subunit